MKVHIFSDVRCPFCFVGKRKFEKALESFDQKEDIEVVWHSFQLDPSLKTQVDIDPMEFFSQHKGVTLEQARMMHGHAEAAGKEVGIDFNFAEQKIANSFRAHLLIQLAKTKGKGNEIEEALFQAQFLKSKNIDSTEDLVEIGTSVGLEEKEIRDALVSDDMAYKVKQDEQLAQRAGVRAVPFFVFNDKYGVSGAQSPETFLEVLEKSYSEYKGGEKGLQILADGDNCSIDGECN